MVGLAFMLPLLFRHLGLDRHQLGRIAVLGADVQQQRERLAELDAHRLGAKGEHVVVGEDDPAGAVSEIERAIGRAGAAPASSASSGPADNPKAHATLHQRRSLEAALADQA